MLILWFSKLVSRIRQQYALKNSHIRKAFVSHLAPITVVGTQWLQSCKYKGRVKSNIYLI